MRTEAVLSTLRNWPKPPAPALKRRPNSMLRPILTATGSSPCPSSSPPRRQRKQLPAQTCGARSAAARSRVLHKHNPSPHRFSNLHNHPNLSLGNNNSSHSNRPGLRNSRSSKGGLATSSTTGLATPASTAGSTDHPLRRSLPWLWHWTRPLLAILPGVWSAELGVLRVGQYATNSPSSKRTVSSSQTLGARSTPGIWIPTAAEPPSVVLSPMEK